MIDKMANKQEQLRERVINYYVEHADCDTQNTISHFKSQGMIPKTIRNIIKRYEENGTVERKVGSGRKPSLLTPRNLNKLKDMFTDSDDDWSFRRAAKKFGTCHKHISRTLKSKFNIKCRTKKKAPKYQDSNVETMLTIDQDVPGT